MEDYGETVVVCDAFGCLNALVVPPGVDAHEAVIGHAEWSVVEGTYRCPLHADQQRPWLA
ncbi:MAG TPA: hypothetical protein VEJ84_01000 [Acidimicrobiales bacterium]|nr:hypothetical protein [Acidimicrobiales bacterium]